jgi:hypothetical protein
VLATMALNKQLKYRCILDFGTGLALSSEPKRSVTGLGNSNVGTYRI